MIARTLLCAALALGLVGCVTEDLRGPSSIAGGDSDEINSAIERGELAVDPKTGLISAPVLTIIGPTTVEINQREEAKRTIRFYGVSPVDKNEHPDIQAKALGWLVDHVSTKAQMRVFIRPLPGADLKAKVIPAQILIPNKDGKGYVSATQAMLSQGLLLYDEDSKEIPSNAIRLGFRNKQKEAYDARRGVWKKIRADSQ